MNNKKLQEKLAEYRGQPLCADIPKYQHIERLGKDDVEGLLDGDVIVQTKIDGANLTVAWTTKTGHIIASRNNTKSVGGEPKNGFNGAVEYCLGHAGLMTLSKRYILRGEWLVRHSTNYPKEYMQHFYVFDVQRYEDYSYLHPDEYIPMLITYGIKYIPVLARLTNPTMEELTKIMEGPDEFGADQKEGIVIKRYCVTLGHKVLLSNLEWVPVESLKIGDKLLAFTNDRFTKSKNENYPISQRWKVAEVTGNDIIKAPVFKITLSDGTILRSTGEHPWLTFRAHATDNGYRWTTTEKLKPGTKIKRLLPVWKNDRSYNLGWLAGIFDGEGTLIHNQPSVNTAIETINVVISQNVGILLDNIKKLLTKYNFPYSFWFRKNCARLIITGGKKENLRFLGQVRPLRLLSSLNLDKIGGIKSGHQEILEVLSVEPDGEKEVVALGTTTETYLVEGFGSHNTYINKYGRVQWGKLVHEGFQMRNKLAFQPRKADGLEIKFASETVTEHLVLKIINKIKSEDPNNDITIKKMPQILGLVWYDVFTEELWDFVKKNKVKEFNFFTVKKLVDTAAREIALAYFNGILKEK